MDTAAVKKALGQAIKAWDDFIGATGIDTDFRLHTGERFSLRVVRRRKADEDITDGLQQKGFEIQFMASQWVRLAPAGRRPEKGDQVTMEGRRHAIETAKLVSYDNTEIGYVARVLG